MSGHLDGYLAFALQVALDAGRVALEHYQTGVAVELKADASPVTRADRGAEQLIRQAIATQYPDHAVVGEEYGADGRRSAFRWIVDPIDGTKSFIRGVPLFGVLVALEIDGQPEVGVCHMPALGETVAAATGLGCTWNGRSAHVSTVEDLRDATIVFSDGRMLTRRLGHRWVRLESEAGLLRSWGESGGRFTDWTGVARIDGGDAVSTNEKLHAGVLELLRGA